MRTLTTLTLKRDSTAFLTSTLLASGRTLNNTCCTVSVRSEPFSEMTGALTISCGPLMTPTFLPTASMRLPLGSGVRIGEDRRRSHLPPEALLSLASYEPPARSSHQPVKPRPERFGLSIPQAHSPSAW